MNLFLKCDVQTAFKKIVAEQMDSLELKYEIKGFGEIEIQGSISDSELAKVRDGLLDYGIEILENPKGILIQRIKDAIIELVYTDDQITSTKVSTFLTQRLHHGYGYLSKHFSESTFSSIENYIILQKVERAKQLISTNTLTFTEIAWKLNYSSVAHFSTQFKSATGLTPTAFQRIINKRKASENNTA